VAKSLRRSLPDSNRNAYRLIGYTSERNCDYLDTRRNWAEFLAEYASQVTAKIQEIGGRIVLSHAPEGLHVNGMVNIFFRVARWIHEDEEHHSQRWIIQCRGLPDGWIRRRKAG
jgi:hypothetical protein